MLDPEENEKLWFGLIAQGDDEILSSLLNPVSARDYFLKIKAEPLLDHTRLYRVARKRLHSGQIKTLLDDPHICDFEEYLEGLDEDARQISDWIPYGYVLNNTPEAICLKTDGGSVVLVSEVLRNALFFMNLGFSNLFGHDDVPDDVKSAAIMIAARTMALDEALDFELDPRGTVPTEILARTWAMVSWQMKFIIGHEFAHHRLGHLSTKTTTYRAMNSPHYPSSNRSWEAVARNWDQEFAADFASINSCVDPDDRLLLLQGAVTFFLFLEFFEVISEHFDESLREANSHPKTISRLEKVIENFRSELEIDVHWARHTMEYVVTSAEELLSAHKNEGNIFGWYGSVYLGQWKGPDLVDRVDY